MLDFLFVDQHLCTCYIQKRRTYISQQKHCNEPGRFRHPLAWVAVNTNPIMTVILHRPFFFLQRVVKYYLR